MQQNLNFLRLGGSDQGHSVRWVLRDRRFKHPSRGGTTNSIPGPLLDGLARGSVQEVRFRALHQAYLTQKQFIQRGNNSLYAITAEAVDYLERHHLFGGTIPIQLSFIYFTGNRGTGPWENPTQRIEAMPKSNEMAGDILAFVEAHPHGWSHDQWLGLLHHLGSSGQDISNPDLIGLTVERTRVQSALKHAGIKGLGPKRIDAIAAAYSFLPELRDIDPKELAARTGIPGKLAQEIAATFRSW